MVVKILKKLIEWSIPVFLMTLFIHLPQVLKHIDLPDNPSTYSEDYHVPAE